MGTIFSGVGLISGLDTQAIVDRLIAIEGRPRDLLRTRVSNLGAQKAALLDISARIAAMLSRLTSLSQRGSFQTNSAASSDPTVLSATVGDGAPPGAYSFLVRSLATTQQVVSRGFASTTAPLGAGTLTVESARARANTRTRLDELNGYTGVQRGSFELVDATGARKTIGIGDAVTLGDVVERINSAGINVRAAVRGDKLVLTETTGGTLQVREIDDGRTAADLGFGAGRTYSTSGRIEGSDLIRLSNATPLSALNDGNGVRSGRGGGDFSINGMNVDLSGLLMVSTRLERLNHGSGVNLGRIRITTYDADDHAVAREIDLTGLRTIGEVKSAIEASGARVSVAVTGEKLIINNTTQTENKRLVIEDVTGTAARDLGIAGSADAKINGGRVLYNDTSADLLAAINYADTSDGTIHASFQGARLVIEAGASATLTRLNDSKALFDLGFEEGAQSGTTESKRLLAGIDSVLLRTLNGGRGVDAGVVNISMNGQTVLADLDGSESLQDVVDRMNDAIRSAGMAAEVAYDATGTRLVARSLDGVTAVSIADQYGSFAQTFGLNQSAANVRGTNVQRRWISENTALASLNAGRGVSSGSIKITNSQGLFREVDLTSAKTLQDVIGAINATNIGVTARINDNGDGLLLEDSSRGSGVMSIAEVGGSAARDLNILGQAQNSRIDGSFELRIDVSAGQSLQDLVNRVNQDAGAPVSASILNDGTATAPFRLQLNARNSGSMGEVLIDAGTTGLDFATLSRAQDARVVLGGSEGGVMLISSTNTIRNIVPGLSLTLSGVSDQPVTVTVSQDHAASKEAMSGLVDDFNAAIDRIRELSGYDSETDERGILLGDSTTNNIESRLLRTMTGALPGGAGAIRRWGQIGISIKNGHLEFDEAKFDAAYAQNPDGVIDLFTRAETGVAASLKKTLESLSESGTGMIARRTGALDSQSDDLKDRIAELNDLLDRKRERLMRQYQAMEQVLSQLQSQGSTLSQIASLSQSAR